MTSGYFASLFFLTLTLLFAFPNYADAAASRWVLTGGACASDSQPHHAPERLELSSADTHRALQKLERQRGSEFEFVADGREYFSGLMFYEGKKVLTGFYEGANNEKGHFMFILVKEDQLQSGAEQLWLRDCKQLVGDANFIRKEKNLADHAKGAAINVFRILTPKKDAPKPATGPQGIIGIRG